MIIPIRCFSCNAVVSKKWYTYIFLTKEEGIPPKEVFEKLGIKRYCCKRMFLSQPDNMLDDVIEHYRDFDYVEIY